MSSKEVAEAIGRGVRDAGAEPVLMAAADGGEGTMEVLVDALGGETQSAAAHDPLGRPIEAAYGVLDGDRAVVEVASASGLGLVAESERDPEAASSAGTGELIAAAIEAGAKRVLVAAGGSATTDGGAGAIEALEARGGTGGAELEVLCDTSVPFEDAARVFAPQKGAGDDAVARLSELLTARAGALPRDPRGRAMTGAAGGLAGGLWAAFGARLVPGAAHVLGVLRFDRALEDLGPRGGVITGEGRVDAQTLEGKLVGELARRCRGARVPLHVIGGEIALDAAAQDKLGAASVQSAGTPAELEAAARDLASPSTGR
jgi:glycerate kinase